MTFHSGAVAPGDLLLVASLFGGHGCHLAGCSFVYFMPRAGDPGALLSGSVPESSKKWKVLSKFPCALIGSDKIYFLFAFARQLRGEKRGSFVPTQFGIHRIRAGIPFVLYDFIPFPRHERVFLRPPPAWLIPCFGSCLQETCGPPGPGSDRPVLPGSQASFPIMRCGLAARFCPMKGVCSFRVAAPALCTSPLSRWISVGAGPLGNDAGPTFPVYRQGNNLSRFLDKLLAFLVSSFLFGFLLPARSVSALSGGFLLLFRCLPIKGPVLPGGDLGPPATPD